MFTIPARMAVVAAIAAVLPLSGTAQAATYSFGASADTMASPKAPSATSGGVRELVSDYEPYTVSYVRFSVSNCAGVVTRATLQLRTVDSASGATGDGPRVFQSASEWKESTLNWNNRPLISGDAVADSGSIGQNSQVNYDVTARIVGNGTYSFAIVPDSADGLYFQSRENIVAPRLVVDCVVPDTVAPTTPTGLVASASSTTSARLTWNPSSDNSGGSGMAGYQVFRGTDLVSTVTSTDYVDSGLAAGTAYTYAVRAIDRSGNVSASSTAVRVTTPSTTETVIYANEFSGSAGQFSDASWSLSNGDNIGYAREACFKPANVTRNGAGQLAILGKKETCGTKRYSAGDMKGPTIPVPTGSQKVKMEARMKGPCGSGAWPAFWTTGTTGAWPSDGEIDMVELYGNDETKAPQNLHVTDNAGQHVHWPFTNRSTIRYCADYHTYGVIWSVGAITFTIDGTPTVTRTRSEFYNKGWRWPFDSSPQQLRFDLALGEHAGTVDETKLPMTMLVDWVRVTRS